MNNISKNFFVWIIITFLLVAVFSTLQQPEKKSSLQEIDYTAFINQVDAQQIDEVIIQGSKIFGQVKDTREQFFVFNPGDANLIARLEKSGVRVQARPQQPKEESLGSIFLSWLPMIIIIGLWIFFIRQMQSNSGKAMSFGKSRAKMLTEKQGKVTFSDVAGIDEAKQELEEVVEFLRDPGKFQRLGGQIPKGVLLVGPPGTGKTLLARAIAGEANVPFFTISGSDFVEMFVGVGASRVRDMFEQAKKNSPCIVFIDEIDAVGRSRGAGIGGGNDEREQTLNQLLVEMDGFEANEGVILIAATNRPDVLDPALLRPGRFDRQVVVPNPDVLGRQKILKVHMKKVPLGEDVDARVIARGTPGFSGADLANLVNEAALLAARKNKKSVNMIEFEEAKDKVMMGAERRSMAMNEEEKKLTAYHEAGHAIVGINCEHSDPIHKATIIPRGRALGMVMRLPEGDRYSLPKAKLHDDLAVAMGGRIAEEMIFGAEMVTTGASGDIKMATDMARKMVTEWGMSDLLGHIAYEESQESYLGAGRNATHSYSGTTLKNIEEEVKRLVDDGYKRAEDILTEKKDDLETLAQALLEYETLSGDEIQKLLSGEDINRDAVLKKKKSKIDGSAPKSSVPSTGPDGGGVPVVPA